MYLNQEPFPFTFPGYPPYKIRKAVKADPQHFYDKCLLKGKTPEEAYRLCVDEYLDPLIAGYSFCTRRGGKFRVMDRNAAVGDITGPSDYEEVRVHFR